MTIADIYDALTATDRPYKRAVPRERALDILRMEASEGMLDRVLLDAFVGRDGCSIARAAARSAGRLTAALLRRAGPYPPPPGVSIVSTSPGCELHATLGGKRLAVQQIAADGAWRAAAARRAARGADAR